MDERNLIGRAKANAKQIMDFCISNQHNIALATLQFYALSMGTNEEEEGKWCSDQMGSIVRVTVAIVTGMLVDVD